MSIRGSRACGAALVLVLHGTFVWLLTHAPMGESPSATKSEPVTITLVEDSRRRNLYAAPPVVKVVLADSPPPQIVAPSIDSIPTDEPEEAVISPPAPSLPASPAPAVGGPGRLLMTRVGARYPADAMRRREEGTTQVMMRVDEAGRVVEVQVVASSGSPRLDDAAVSSFRKWRFASVPRGTDPEGSWVRTSQRFLLTQIRYSLLEDQAADEIRVTETGARDAAQSAGGQALRGFLDAVADGRLGESTPRGRAQLAQLRAALAKWGLVESVQLISTAGPAQWTAYRVSEDLVANAGRSRVDCKWAVLEVRHANATTVWLIAFDRNGTIWSARTGPA